MNIFRLAEDLLVIYILYKIVFSFIIPVAQTAKQMKNKMNDVQQHMREQQQAQAAQQKRYEQERTVKQTKAPSDDYIDYEEVK